MIEELLTNHSLKITKCRVDLLKKINQLGKSSTIKNIVENLNYDKSTIYRNIEKLLKNKIITKEIIDDNVIYKIYNNHYHVLKCINCNNETQIDTCPFDSNVIGEFKILMHTKVIEGICNNCQKK